MHSSIWARWQGCLLSCLLFQFLFGCASVDPVALREREVEDLRYKTARMRESLRDSFSVSEKLREELRSAEKEKSKLRDEVLGLSTSLRFANEQANSLTSQRDNLKAELAYAEEVRQRTEESLVRVKSVASASAGELTDLRLKSRELGERLNVVSKSNKLLSDEGVKLSGEVEKLQAALVRTRAVVRSLRGTGAEALQGEVENAASQVSLERLQRENADLRGERIALEKRIEQLEAKMLGSTEAPAIALGAVYRERPAGLLEEFVGE